MTRTAGPFARGGHFPVAEVGRIASIQLGKMLQTAPARLTDLEVSYLNAGSIAAEEQAAKPRTMFASPRDIVTFSIRLGDLLVAEGGDVGRSVFAPATDDTTIIQNSLHRVRCSTGDTRFLQYALCAIYDSGWLSALTNRATFGHLTVEKLSSLLVPWPTVKSQRSIADYLDTETARINGLIVKRRRLISALRERQKSRTQAILTEAGGRPAGRMKHVVNNVLQGWSPECLKTSADGMTTWGVLKAGAVNNGIFRPEENKELPAEVAARPDLVVEPGDLVVSRANTRDLVGSAAVVEQPYPRLMLCDKLYAFRLDHAKALPRFIALTLGTRPYRDLIMLEATGASPSMQNISQADILNLPLTLPSVDTQARALRLIDAEARRTDRLIDLCATFVALAQERRRALITAAVTGELDIPGAA